MTMLLRVMAVLAIALLDGAATSMSYNSGGEHKVDVIDPQHKRQIGQESQVPHQTSLVSIQEIRREPLGFEDYRYVLRYSKNTDHVHCSVTNLSEEQIFTVIDDRVEEVSVVVNESQDNEDSSRTYWFLCSNTDNTTGLLISVGKPRELTSTSESQAIVQTAHDIGMPWMDINPQNEIIYAEGEDIDIKVTVDNGFGETFYKGYLYDLNSQEKVYEAADLSGPENAMTPPNDNQVIEYNVTISTSNRRLSGIFDFRRVNFHFRPNSLIRAITVNKFSLLKPEGVSKPFPERAMGFINHGPAFCDLTYDLCSYKCEAVGGAIDDIKVFKVQQGGGLSPVHTFHQYNNNYFKSSVFEISLPSSFQTSYTPEYICKIENSLGMAETRKVIVAYIMTPNILDEGTSANLATNGNGSTLVLECSAKGIPIPEIFFSATFTYHNVWDEPADDTTISVNGMDVTGTKTYTWDNSYEYLISVSCVARSMYGNDYKEIYFTVEQDDNFI